MKQIIIKGIIMNISIGLVRFVGSAAFTVLIYVLLAQSSIGAELSA